MKHTERNPDRKQDSIEQEAWVPNAAGNIATRSVTSLLPMYVSGNGVRTAFIVPLTNTRNISEKEKRERSYNFNRLVMTVLNTSLYEV